MSIKISGHYFESSLPTAHRSARAYKCYWPCEAIHSTNICEEASLPTAELSQQASLPTACSPETSLPTVCQGASMYNGTGLERPNRVQESARRRLCRLPKPRERRFKWPPFNHIQRKKQVKNCLCPTCKGQKSWTLHPIFSFHLTFFLFPVSFFPFFFFGSTHSFSSERTTPYPYHQSNSLFFFHI